jgi:hypothetical protein
MNESVLSQLARMDLGRIKNYKELLDFYFGRQWEGKSRWHERRLTFNYAKVFIEKVTSYLMGDISFVVEPYKDSDRAREIAKRAEATLKRIYGENCLEQLDLETEIDYAVLGDGCYKVIWDVAEKRVRITAPDVQGIYAWYLGDDTSRLWRIASKYQLSREEVELLYGVKSRNKTAVVVELWTDRDFELYIDDTLLEAKPNPYGFIPFIIFPNLREPKKFWGASDLPQIMESQRELNRAMSQLSRILELSGNPIAMLDKGCQLSFSPGYRTTAGDESSDDQTYCLESIEHISAGGKASVILRARDGWGALGDWDARHQMRWNKTSNEKSVKDIIAVILAKAGLKLEVKSQSSTVTGFYPDFTISPNDNGKTVIEKLLSFVPDVIFIEGNKAYLVNPQSTDSSEYGYGTDHAILEGRYRQGALIANRAQVEGYDTSQSKILVVDSLAWAEVDRLYDRIKHVDDRNLSTTAQGYQRGAALLRKAEIDAAGGAILVPVNCGHQLYDVIDVTDAGTGLAAAKRRVLGSTLIYRPQRSEYLQRLELGGV